MVLALQRGDLAASALPQWRQTMPFGHTTSLGPSRALVSSVKLGFWSSSDMNNLKVVFVDGGGACRQTKLRRYPICLVRRHMEPNLKNDSGSVMSAYAQSRCYNSALGKAYGMLLGF